MGARPHGIVYAEGGKNMETSGITDDSVVPLRGRGVVIREYFPEVSKTEGKNERWDRERDGKSTWSYLVGWV